VLVVNGRAIAAMERRSTDASFKSNISLGGVGVAFEPPPAMADLAMRVTAALNLDVAGVDILLDENGCLVCEANSSPGFQGLEKACRISVPDEIFTAMRLKLGLPRQPRPNSWRRLVGSVRNSFQFEQSGT
jgi:gamma-F420-2:alpha-L-glutamate ligase